MGGETKRVDTHRPHRADHPVAEHLAILAHGTQGVGGVPVPDAEAVLHACFLGVRRVAKVLEVLRGRAVALGWVAKDEDKKRCRRGGLGLCGFGSSAGGGHVEAEGGILGSMSGSVDGASMKGTYARLEVGRRGCGVHFIGKIVN